MANLSQDQSTKREKTLLAAAMLSAPGPLVTGMAAFSSHSSTQLADFIRRSAELVALIVSWWVFRYLQHHSEINEAGQKRLERMANLSVAGAMSFSGIIMILIAISRFFNYELAGNVIVGLVIAILGFLVNTWFWRRYAHLNREQYDSVIAAQVKLYRAKAFVDLCVVTALMAVTIAPAHPVTRYVDIIGSIIVAIYLLYSGIGMVRESTEKPSMKYSIQSHS